MKKNSWLYTLLLSLLMPSTLLAQTYLEGVIKPGIGIAAKGKAGAKYREKALKPGDNCRQKNDEPDTITCLGPEDDWRLSWKTWKKVNGKKLSVKFPGPIAHLATTSENTCGALTNGEVYCIGSNDHAGLGYYPSPLTSGSDTGSIQPVRIKLAVPAQSVYIDFPYLYARGRDRQMYRWGFDPGTPEGDTKKRNISPNRIYIPHLKEARSISLGTHGFFWAGAKGELWRSQTDTHGPTLEVSRIPLAERVASLQSRYGEYCALTEGGRVYCWGGSLVWGGKTRWTKDAQVYDQIEATQSPTLVNLPEPVTHLFVASGRACAYNDRRFFCWGLDPLNKRIYHKTPVEIR